MALTSGMLERFKRLASEKDNSLLKIELSNGKKLYGYLREIGEDFFVLEEFKKHPSGKTEKAGKKTSNLSLVESFSEISSDMMPTPPRSLY